MAHLALHNFVHRDLAARNVLLGSGMVCKVADFGLSRRVQTEDNTGDYYRSSSGVIPVRWTAPEGITSQRFSSASDVWSFGITCVEIFLDGGRPYPGVNSNPDVVKMVCTQGLVHPRPEGCPGDIYSELSKCWSTDPDERPEFNRLKAFFLATSAEINAATVASQRLRPPPRSNGDGGVSSVSSGANALGANGVLLGLQMAYDLGHQDVGDGAGEQYNLGYGGTMVPTPAPLQIVRPRVTDATNSTSAKGAGWGGRGGRGSGTLLLLQDAASSSVANSTL